MLYEWRKPNGPTHQYSWETEDANTVLSLLSSWYIYVYLIAIYICIVVFAARLH